MNIVEPIRDKKIIKKIEKRLKLKSERDYVMFVLGINSGLRISDILALSVRDVKNKAHINIIEKKTKKQKRLLMNLKLKILLDKFVADRADDEPLFKTKYGGRLDRFQAYKIINLACKKVGLECKIGTHSLRKTFGYHHYQQFKNIAILQKIFNHTSQSTTLRYIGIEQDEIDRSYRDFVL